MFEVCVDRRRNTVITKDDVTLTLSHDELLKVIDTIDALKWAVVINPSISPTNKSGTRPMPQQLRTALDYAWNGVTLSDEAIHGTWQVTVKKWR